MATQTTIAAALQDKIDAKASIKAAIEAKGVTVGNALLSDYAAKIDKIVTDPTIPVGTGKHLVTFYDFDGKILKRERVATGGNATAPTTPTHQYLTFAEWNNPFTNVQSDIDTGAIYNTTDGKTYLFITLTPVTGLAPTLYFSKSSTSLMTIDWGDGTTSTSTTSGNQTIQHTYSTAGDYIITVDNSAGGTWKIGQGNSATALFSNGIYSFITTKIYLGNYTSILSGLQFQKFKYLSVGTYILDLGSLQNATNVEHINLNQKNPTGSGYGFRVMSSLKKIITKTTLDTIPINSFESNRIKNYKFNQVATIGANAFLNSSLTIEYIFLSPTPPTLANINAFTGINPLCKIYVPDASVEAYKTATNWNNYANYIYPLSTKPQSNE